MKYEDFLKIATYGNKAWKGSFSEEEVARNAEDYFCEWKASKEKGAPTPVMQELCKLLIDDIEGGSDKAVDYLEEIFMASEWEVYPFYCSGCNKREIVFFSKAEVQRLELHKQRKMLISDAIPDKPQWIREVFVSGICLCPECWQKYWSGNLTPTDV